MNFFFQARLGTIKSSEATDFKKAGQYPKMSPRK